MDRERERDGENSVRHLWLSDLDGLSATHPGDLGLRVDTLEGDGGAMRLKSHVI